MKDVQQEVTFEDILGDEDYGLIISGDGSLKGLWVPLASQDKPVPDTITELCINYFGIDPNQSVSLH